MNIVYCGYFTFSIQPCKCQVYAAGCNSVQFNIFLLLVTVLMINCTTVSPCVTRTPHIVVT
jgi:hypothetical protein